MYFHNVALLLQLQLNYLNNSFTTIWGIVMVTSVLTWRIPLGPATSFLTSTYVRIQVSVLMVQGTLGGEIDTQEGAAVIGSLILFLTIQP